MMMPTSGFFVFEWAFAGIYRSSDLGAPIAACETDKFIAQSSDLENFEKRFTVFHLILVK
jgi:hypothetical protein